MIKVIACDLDGTLLYDGKVLSGSITKQNIEAIHRWQQAGNEFVIASGRPHEYAATLKELGLDLDMLGSNGSVVYMNKEVVMCNRIDMSVLARFDALLKQYEQKADYIYSCVAPYHVFSTYEGFCFRSFGHELQFGQTLLVEEVLTQKIDVQAVKLFVRLYDQKDTAVLFNHIKKKLGDVLNPSTTSPFNIEITKFGVSKGSALLWLARKKNLPCDAFAVIGDENNDVEMLQFTPHSYAMHHANDEVKHHANKIVHHVHEMIDDCLAINAQQRNL